MDEREFALLLPWIRIGIRMLEREANGLDPFGYGEWIDSEPEVIRKNEWRCFPPYNPKGE